MNIDLGGLLQQVLGADAQGASDPFHQAAQAAGPDLLSQGLSAMFRSDQTPAFGELAGQLFGQANADQRSGMLMQLVQAMGPTVLASLAGGQGASGLGGLLGQLAGAGDAASLSDAAARMSPEQFQQMASHAEQHSPGVIEQMSAFCAEHPALVSTLGSAALGLVLRGISGRQGGA